MYPFLDKPTLIEQVSEDLGKYLDPYGKVTLKKIVKDDLEPFNKLEESIYKRYIASAKKRNKEFTLTKHFFKKVINSNCTYCYYKNGLNGIDRLDNSIGYVFSNCVPCCKICNRAKHCLGFYEFDNWLENLQANYKKHYDVPDLNKVQILMKKLNRKQRKTTLSIMKRHFVKNESLIVYNQVINKKDFLEFDKKISLYN